MLMADDRQDGRAVRGPGRRGVRRDASSTRTLMGRRAPVDPLSAAGRRLPRTHLPMSCTTRFQTGVRHRC